MKPLVARGLRAGVVRMSNISSFGSFAKGCCNSFLPKVRKDATKMHQHLSTLSDINGVATSAIQLARMRQVQGSHADKALGNVENVLDVAGGVINIVDTGASTLQLVTGDTFYETGEDGTFVLQNSAKGGCNPAVLTPRSPLSIMSSVTRLAAKYLSATGFLGRREVGVLDLGNHADSIGIASSSLGAASSALGAVDDILDMVEDVQETRNNQSGFLNVLTRLRATLLSFFCNLLDLLSELGGLVSSVAPSVWGPITAAAFGVIGLFANVGNLVQDLDIF